LNFSFSTGKTVDTKTLWEETSAAMAGEFQNKYKGTGCGEVNWNKMAPKRTQ
jgi:hypothetical protein